MDLPPSLAQIILDILTHGILRCRAAGWSGNAQRCAIEADHIHNLPALLKEFKPELLQYYWNAERPSFIEQCSRSNISVEGFQPFWDSLSKLMGIPIQK